MGKKENFKKEFGLGDLGLSKWKKHPIASGINFLIFLCICLSVMKLDGKGGGIVFTIVVMAIFVISYRIRNDLL